MNAATLALTLDAAAAEVRTLAAEYEAAIAAGEAAAEGLASRLEVAQTRIAELEALLDPPDPEPDPDPVPTPPRGDWPVLGASDGDWPVKGLPATDALDGIRPYLGGNGLRADTSWTGTKELSNAVARMVPRGLMWLSIKDARPDELDRLLGNRPDKIETIVVTLQHEPENDLKLPLTDERKKADIAAYQRGWELVLPVIARNDALSATCLLGDRVSPDKPNNPESLAYHVPGVDVIGFDRYNPGLGNAKRYTPPAEVLGACVQYVANRNREDGKPDRPLGIGEWGSPSVGFVNDLGEGGDQEGRRKWAAAYVKELRTIHADPSRPDVITALYFNSFAISRKMRFNSDTTGALATAALGR